MNWLACTVEPFRARAGSFLRGERGLILPLTLMILLILATLVASLLAIGALEPQIAANVLRGNQALSLAEAGAERAIAYFVADSVNSLSSVNIACDPSCPGPPTDPNPFGGAVTLDTIGTYTVTQTPISFATILIESKGVTTAGSVQRKVRVVLTTQWTSKFGVLGKDVEVSGSATVEGSAGAIHGNNSAKVSGADSLRVNITATTANADPTKCDGCSDAVRVGSTAGSGAGKPNETIPNVTPLSLKDRATIMLGDDVTPIPASCVGAPGVGGNTVVPEHKILTVATCTLTNENTGVFANVRMGGAGEWRFEGATNPPDGTYYSMKETKVTSSLGFPAVWKATLISGGTSEQGKVEISGSPKIEPFYGDLLTVAGEVKFVGNAKLRGVAFATGSAEDPTGKIEVSGNTELIGNIVTNGRAKVTGSGGKVIYNVATRTRLLGPLRILSWSTASQ